VNTFRALGAILVILVMCVSAEAQLFQRRVCVGGVCRTEWVPVQQYTRVYQTVPRFNRQVYVAPAQDFVQESYIVSPSEDLQIQAVESLRVGDRAFIRTVRDATSAARQAGKISVLQQARVLAAVRLPRVGKEVEQLIAAELEVPTSATGLIDWENFDPEKFMALIEGILKILLLFGIGA
jgi:hypothetical protein